MNISEAKKIALDYAVQSIRLITTLSTSVIAITVTFAKEFGEISIGWQIKCAWILLIISMFCGLFAMFKIIGNIGSAKTNSILYESWFRWFAIIQISTFFIGILVIVLKMILQ